MEEIFAIEPFDKNKHKTERFDCGEADLNDFIACYAFQQQKKGVGRTFVFTNQQKEVVGYYTLSAGSIRHEEAPEALKKKLPKYPIPTITLGRIAVDKRYQRKGIGKKLLKDALLKVVFASNSIGVVAVVVNAKNEKAAEFYKQYGFISFENFPRKLFLPVKTIQMALSK